jgi:hypothetical protein
MEHITIWIFIFVVSVWCIRELVKPDPYYKPFSIKDNIELDDNMSKKSKRWLKKQKAMQNNQVVPVHTEPKVPYTPADTVDRQEIRPTKAGIAEVKVEELAHIELFE